jgi:hypothetical protein
MKIARQKASRCSAYDSEPDFAGFSHGRGNFSIARKPVAIAISAMFVKLRFSRTA